MTPRLAAAVALAEADVERSAAHDDHVQLMSAGADADTLDRAWRRVTATADAWYIARAVYARLRAEPPSELDGLRERVVSLARDAFKLASEEKRGRGVDWEQRMHATTSAHFEAVKALAAAIARGAK